LRRRARRPPSARRCATFAGARRGVFARWPCRLFESSSRRAKRRSNRKLTARRRFCFASLVTGILDFAYQRDIVPPESNSIGELAEALSHCKAPEAILMILTAYMDESGTHGPSAVSVMGACVADVRQWRKFEKRTIKLFRRYGVKIFHTIDLKRGDGDFRGWSVDKKIAFLDDLAHIKNETMEFGYAVVLKHADYQEFYANRERPKRSSRTPNMRFYSALRSLTPFKGF
jgi:hypothetical protein